MTGLGKKERLQRERREELNVRPHQGQEGRPLKAPFPGFKQDGLRNLAGMPPQEVRPYPVPLPQEREPNCGPGAGGAGDLAEAPTKVAQTEWDEWDERVECDRIKAIKVNQAKSSQLGYPIDSTNPKV
jgi:hypothetical protein